MTCLADRQSFGKLLISKKCAVLYTISEKHAAPPGLEPGSLGFIQTVLKLLNTNRSVKSMAVLWQFF